MKNERKSNYLFIYLFYFFIEEDNSSSNDTNEYFDEEGIIELMLISLESKCSKLKECELSEEEEGDVDLARELISALEEIDRLKEKNKKHKEIMLKYVKEDPKPKELIQLKFELEEAKKVEDVLLQQLK